MTLRVCILATPSCDNIGGCGGRILHGARRWQFSHALLIADNSTSIGAVYDVK